MNEGVDGVGANHFLSSESPLSVVKSGFYFRTTICDRATSDRDPLTFENKEERSDILRRDMCGIIL